MYAHKRFETRQSVLRPVRSAFYSVSNLNPPKPEFNFNNSKGPINLMHAETDEAFNAAYKGFFKKGPGKIVHRDVKNRFEVLSTTPACDRDDDSDFGWFVPEEPYGFFLCR